MLKVSSSVMLSKWMCAVHAYCGALKATTQRGKRSVQEAHHQPPKKDQGGGNTRDGWGLPGVAAAAVARIARIGSEVSWRMRT
jgi:hypothetical protein